MQVYNNPGNGCIHGDCLVQMEHGFKKVELIRKGDTVQTRNGITNVLCAIESKC